MDIVILYHLQYAKEEMSKIVAQQPPTLQQFSTSQAPTASLPGPSFQSPPPTFGNAQVSIRCAQNDNIVPGGGVVDCARPPVDSRFALGWEHQACLFAEC